MDNQKIIYGQTRTGMSAKTAAQELAIEKMKDPKIAKLKKDLHVSNAKKQLLAQLNYGGIHIETNSLPPVLAFEFEEGELGNEIEQMRRISAAFEDLANILETKL